MDPITAGFILSAGKTAPSGPSSSWLSSPFTGSNDFRQSVDNSGWNVNFGGGTVSSAAQKTISESDPLGLAGLTAGISQNWVIYAALGLVAVLVIKLMKRN